MIGGFQFDTLHIILLTGFLSFFSALASHVITKWVLSKKYITFTQCKLIRDNCSLDEIKKDIKDIKEIQHNRTTHLTKRARAEVKIWREVLTSLKVTTKEQNEWLEDL